jgi:hypothetical protein
VPSDDLRSIPGLQDKYRRVLTGKLKITTFRALVDADQHAIYRAMRDSHLRPTREQIAKWQDHARSGLREAKTNRSEWHPAASFAVVFAQRQVDDGWEQRIEVERTEVEPEEERRIWPGWDCGGICEWMSEQVPGAAEPEPEAEPEPGGETETEAAARATEPAAAPAPPAGARERPELRISSVAIIGAAAAEGVSADVAVTPSRADPAERLRIEITVSGARPDQEIYAVARALHPGESGGTLQDPVVIKGAGVASFDLSRLPPGRHTLTLVAWAPDGNAQPALEELTIVPR